MSMRGRARWKRRCGGWNAGLCLAVCAGAVGGCSSRETAAAGESGEEPILAQAADLVHPVLTGAGEVVEPVWTGTVEVVQPVVVGAADVGKGLVNLVFLDGSGSVRKPMAAPASGSRDAAECASAVAVFVGSFFQ